jgi:para-aminobenzoate synthetase/4-amino-4-deoxychorismate lyase
MKIIRGLESTPRGVYTGAVGFIAPHREAAVFNVAIRTVAARGPHAEMGLGGGIVYDSDPESEWLEALLKGDFLLGALDDAAPRDFSLIETLLWSPRQGYYLAQLHLERLMFAADHFGFHCDMKDVAERLRDFAETLEQNDVPQRVRMLMDRQGNLTFTNFDVDADFSFVEPLCTFSERTVFSGSPFLRHKTTVRGFYNAEQERAVKGGYADVIFLNERGEVTEGTVTNVMVRIGDTVYTPPLSCGLLDGVFRRHLLETKQVNERVLYPEDVTGAAAVYLCNSVRGLFKVNLRVPLFLHGRQAIKMDSCGGH